jgi:putative ABC transport system substrate-binding protein
VGSDPVPFGLVKSLSRPTGNATGVTLFSSTLMAKRLEFLREIAPNASLIALLMNPDNLNYRVDVEAAEAAARGLGRQTLLAHAKSPAEIDGAFDAIAQKRAGAVLVASDPMFLGQRRSRGARHQARAVGGFVDTRIRGCRRVAQLRTSIAWMYREAGAYVGRILKGAKPSDLPVMQPTNFELVINLKTAKALGLSVSQPLLLRADEVIH